MCHIYQDEITNKIRLYVTQRIEIVMIGHDEKERTQNEVVELFIIKFPY